MRDDRMPDSGCGSLLLLTKMGNTFSAVFGSTNELPSGRRWLKLRTSHRLRPRSSSKKKRFRYAALRAAYLLRYG